MQSSQAGVCKLTNKIHHMIVVHPALSWVMVQLFGKEPPAMQDPAMQDPAMQDPAMQDKALYQHILGLTSPWTVSEVKLNMQDEEIQVRVEHPVGTKFCCPECKKQLACYDHA